MFGMASHYIHWLIMVLVLYCQHVTLFALTVNLNRIIVAINFSLSFRRHKRGIWCLNKCTIRVILLRKMTSKLSFFAKKIEHAWAHNKVYMYMLSQNNFDSQENYDYSCLFEINSDEHFSGVAITIVHLFICCGFCGFCGWRSLSISSHSIALSCMHTGRVTICSLKRIIWCGEVLRIYFAKPVNASASAALRRLSFVQEEKIRDSWVVYSWFIANYQFKFNKTKTKKKRYEITFFIRVHNPWGILYRANDELLHAWIINRHVWYLCAYCIHLKHVVLFH